VEDIHPAVQEPLIPSSVPALVMTPVIALATHRTSPPTTNQAQMCATVVVGLLNIHLGDGTPRHLHHQLRDLQNRNHQV
jgi:hypothetical protein